MKIIITESQIQNIIKTNLTLESLPMSIGKSYVSIKRSEEIEKQINDAWNELLKLPNIQTSKRKDRIYIPYTGSDDKEAPDIDSPVKKEVEDYLSSKGYTMNDYIKGTVIEPKYNREVKIGKVLDNPDLLKKFNLDDARTGSRQVNSYIVISKHPYDIAGMSTDRGWNSCMNLDDGCNKSYVSEDIRYGTLVAYFIKKNDLNINNPIGRILIKPYSNKNGGILYNVSRSIYGSPSHGFRDQLKDIFSNVNSNNVKSTYYFNDELYRDNDDGEILNFTLEEFGKLPNEQRLEILKSQRIDFEDGLAEIGIDNKYNLVNTNGDLVFSIWYDYIGEFSDGFALVKNNNKYNFINKEGKILLDKWVGYANSFRGGIATISTKNIWNMVNTKGEIILNKWYDFIGDFNYEVTKVKLNKKFNLITKNGEILYDKWFDGITILDNNHFIIMKYINDMGVYNLMNINGEILLDEWYDYINEDRAETLRVRRGEWYTFVNKKGEFLLENWYNYIGSYYDELAKVKISDQYNFINKKGKEISKIWFDRISYFEYGWCRVRVGDKSNYMNPDGEFLSDTWFDRIAASPNGMAQALINDQWYNIDYSGNMTKINGDY